MVLPVVSRGQTAALITLMFTTESGRRYSRDHPPLAEELALHAGHLIENTRLLRELRMNEARFRISIAGVRAVVFEHDCDLRYSWFYNPVIATPTFVGRTDEEMLGAEEAAVLTGLKRRALRGESVHEEVDVTVGGTTGHFREALEPMRNRAGDIIGVIGSATDISDEKRTQQRLQDSVIFRDRMMGVLSHDLKNPLNAITMVVQSMLRESEPGGADRRRLRIVERSAKRMLELIETLLDFTRVQSGGKLPISRVPTDLGDRARDVAEELHSASPGLQIELQMQGNLRGQWDPARIDEALSNLITNAHQHGNPKRPVRVSADSQGDIVELRVRNEGPAIPPNLIPVLFEPFIQGASVVAPYSLGLGLYITKQIVLAHGGEIHVESSDETGTQFSVILPRAA
jgi:signal transduction histidine kinase